jgi:peptide/nickel transport system substrate-binding protein
LDYPAKTARAPLLSEHVGYNKQLVQLPYDPARANALLDQAGWTERKEGIRAKGGVPLAFKLYSQSSGEYAAVAQKLQAQWRAVGVDVEVMLQDNSDLQTTVSQHAYDALLYGISLGTDPDVFPYWHSSQADARLTSRLNFSEYKSTPADKSLEAGRSRSDPTLRAIKYKPFLESWRQDAPAIALYQPRFLYIVRGQIFHFNPVAVNVPADRYSNVHNWMIREARVNK